MDQAGSAQKRPLLSTGNRQAGAAEAPVADPFFGVPEKHPSYQFTQNRSAVKI
jgi:hypothetical protein